MIVLQDFDLYGSDGGQKLTAEAAVVWKLDSTIHGIVIFSIALKLLVV